MKKFSSFGALVASSVLTMGVIAALAGPASAAAAAGTQTATYVSTTGADTRLCPSTAPCATMTYAESQTAIGGTIHVAAGTYYQTVDLTQPITLKGSGKSATIINGTGIDYQSDGNLGLIYITNTSGTSGTIAITGVTVTDPYITANEQSLDSSPADIANYDSQSGDMVTVTASNLGPSEYESASSSTVEPGLGYYSLSAASTSLVKNVTDTGSWNAFFAEGTGGATRFQDDTASHLTGYSAATYGPARGVLGLADEGGALSVTAYLDNFTGYAGWGIQGYAGYYTDTGSLTLDAYHNHFALQADKTGSSPEVAAIQGLVGYGATSSEPDSLTGTFIRSTGTVASPDLAISVITYYGTESVTSNHNSIKVTH